MANQKVAKVAIIQRCDICVYSCVRKYNMDKHYLTLKHIRLTTTSKNPQNVVVPLETNHQCICGKKYKHSSSLAKHKHMCDFAKKISGGLVESSDIILDLLKGQHEFKELLVEQNKQIITLTDKLNSQTIHNTQIINTQNIKNQTNMTFNLNYFLNEKCKDAINMKDFIDSLSVSFTDLENTGRVGFVKSITQYLTRELSKLDIYSRPIHCSDTNRKILHIKDENIWQKDNDQHVTTKKLLSKINHKMNVSQILNWKNANPRCEQSDDKLNSIYLKMVGNLAAGDNDTYEKIITNVSDKISIDKKSPKNMISTSR